MKDEFFEYYTPTAEEFKKLWRDAIIVPDANILLRFLRYSDDYTKVLFDIFKKYKSQLWVPHQAAFEYHKHKEETLIRIETSYEKLKKAMGEAKDLAKNKLTETKDYIDPHPYIDLDEIVSKVEKSFARYTEEIEKKHKEHPGRDFFIKRCNSVSTLFDKKTGDAFDQTQLEEIYQKGKKRYDRNIPPGYKDSEKTIEAERYGDLILWEQLILKASQENKPIIFITDDRKEDWWKINHGRIIGPRPELRREMYDRAGVDFYIYNFDNFLKYASQKISDREVSEKVNKIRKDVRERYTSEETRGHDTPNYVADEIYDLREKIQECDSKLYWLNKESDQIKQEEALVQNSYPYYKDELSDMEYINKLKKLKDRRNEIRNEMDSLYLIKNQLEKKYYEIKDRY